MSVAERKERKSLHYRHITTVTRKKNVAAKTFHLQYIHTETVILKYTLIGKWNKLEVKNRKQLRIYSPDPWPHSDHHQHRRHFHISELSSSSEHESASAVSSKQNNKGWGRKWTAIQINIPGKSLWKGKREKCGVMHNTHTVTVKGGSRCRL